MKVLSTVRGEQEWPPLPAEGLRLLLALPPPGSLLLRGLHLCGVLSVEGAVAEESVWLSPEAKELGV